MKKFRITFISSAVLIALTSALAFSPKPYNTVKYFRVNAGPSRGAEIPGTKGVDWKCNSSTSDCDYKVTLDNNGNEISSVLEQGTFQQL